MILRLCPTTPYYKVMSRVSGKCKLGPETPCRWLKHEHSLSKGRGEGGHKGALTLGLGAVMDMRNLESTRTGLVRDAALALVASECPRSHITTTDSRTRSGESKATNITGFLCY